MSIYRLEKKSISRGGGSNLCAAVAYRGGLEITDTNEKNENAKTHDYRNKSDIAHVEIVASADLMIDAIDAGVLFDVASIAQLVENTETTQRGAMKKNAKLASEFVLAGSHELSMSENIAMFSEFAENIAAEQDTIAMVFVHDPKLKKSSNDNSDDRNIHAHIVMLSRRAKIENGALVLGDKIDLDLSDTERLKRGLSSGAEALTEIRGHWADIQNRALKRHDIAPVTHKSYRDLGLPLKPTVHLGRYEAALMKDGKYSKIGEYNEKIEAENSAHIISTADQYDVATRAAIDSSEQAIGASERVIAKSIDSIAESLDYIEQSKSKDEWLDRKIGGTRSKDEWLDREIERASQAVERTAQRVSEGAQGIIHATQGIIQATRAVKNSQQLIAKSVESIEWCDREIEKRVEHKQLKAEQLTKSAIAQRTAFDLIDVRIDLSVTRPKAWKEDPDLSGDKPIGAELYNALDYQKSGYDVRVTDGKNSHIEGNKTAERIKDFMMTKLQNRQVVTDYGNLTIVKFTEKYALECDLISLKTLHERNPPELTIEPPQPVYKQSARNLSRNDDYDLSM